MGFTKVVENFTCEKCGYEVQGSGYTNHCPRCLWSKHVDIDPGDRAALCGGMMEPVLIEGGSPAYQIVHRCEKCGFERRNMVQVGDDKDAVATIARNRAMRDT